MSPERPSQVMDRERAAVRALLRRHGVESAGVFGSVARGDDGPDSDLDVIVHFAPGVRRDVIALTAALESLLGVQVDVVDDEAVLETARRTGVGSTILAQTVPL